MARPSPAVEFETIGELLTRLGGIAPERVRAKPPPGTATERDLIRVREQTDKLYELVDGTLVEKVMGFPESGLACDLIRLLGRFLDEHDLGDLAGADATMRLLPGLVRIPDVSFISWDRLPNRERPRDPIPDLAPDLAVEVLSEGNTAGEMERKLKEYFLSRVRVVWFVDLRQRTVSVYTSPDECRVFTEEETLDGADVLPGLSLPVRTVFARVPRPVTKRPRKKKAAPPKPKEGEQP